MAAAVTAVHPIKFTGEGFQEKLFGTCDKLIGANFDRLLKRHHKIMAPFILEKLGINIDRYWAQQNKPSISNINENIISKLLGY